MKRLFALAALASACTGATPNPSPPPTPIASASASASAAPDAWRSEVPKPGTPARFSYPVPESAKLENGLTLIVVHRKTEIASLSVVAVSLKNSVPKGKSGLASLCARMLTEGTKKRSALQLAEATEGLGSTLDDDAGRDYSSIGLDTLTEDVGKGLELLAEVVETPAFSPAEFQRVQREWVDGLVSERQSPERLASLAGLRLLLGEPHGAPVGGSVPDVKKLGVKDLVAFHHDHYLPSASAVIVVGDVSVGSVRPAVEQAFGSWRGGQEPPLPSFDGARPPDATHVVLIDRPGAVQSALFVAEPLPKRSEPGHETRQVLNALVGGLFTSRLNHNLREEHAYTYGVRSDAVATRLWGALAIHTSVETPATADALHELVAELGKARDPKLGAPIKDEEVARARADLVNGLAAHLEDNDHVASDFATGFVQALPLDYFANFANTLGGVTTPSVAEEAAKRVDPAHLVVVVVGDKASVEPELVKKGFKVEPAKAELSD